MVHRNSDEAQLLESRGGDRKEKFNGQFRMEIACERRRSSTLVIPNCIRDFQIEEEMPSEEMTHGSLL